MMKRIVGCVVIYSVLAVVLMLPIKTFSADSSNTSLLSASKVVTQVVTLLENAELPSAPNYIQHFASPGLARDISVSITRHSRDFWFDLYAHQLSQFFSSKTVEETYLKIFSHHPRIRS